MALDPEVVKAMTVARSDALTWNTIVGKQYVRVLEADDLFDRQLEMYLFAFAVRAVLRAEDLARSVAERAELHDRVEALRDARAGFDSFVPDAVHVRDILEHFDEYRLGEGRLQRGWAMREYFEWVQTDGPGRHTLVLAGQYRLVIDDAKAACDFLTDKVVSAMRVT